MKQKLPGKYAGSKRAAAPLIWQLLGDPDHYIEPFAGSAAAFYLRPEAPPTRTSARRETIGDADGVIVNLHRAVRAAPGIVAEYAAWPPSDLDQRARLRWVAEHRADLRDSLIADPEWYDARAAGWALYCLCVSISSYAIGSGAPGIMRGFSISPRQSDRRHLESVLSICAERLRFTQIYCGDWRVLLRDRNLLHKDKWTRTASAARIHGVLLDPPYETNAGVYHGSGGSISGEVRRWCRDVMGDHVRTVLAGYDTEHDDLLDHGWTKHAGAASRGKRQGGTEQLWASPACLAPGDGKCSPRMADEDRAIAAPCADLH